MTQNTSKILAEPDAFFATTVNRCAPAHLGGDILKLSRTSRSVHASDAIVPKDPEIDEGANPRGGIRGGRGVIRLDAEHILVSSYHSLLVYTNDLTCVDAHSHPLMSGIHAIALDGDLVWVTSTSIDVLVGYNLNTRKVDRVVDATELACVADLGVKPRRLDLEADFRADPSVVRGDFTHLNSVLKLEDRLLILLNKFGAIVDVNSDVVVAQHRLLRGAHDLVYMRDRNQVAVNDTRSQSFLLFDASSFELVDRLSIATLPGAPLWLNVKKLSLYYTKFSSRVLKRPVTASPLFMRGLAYHDGKLYSGISPAAIFETDVAARRVVREYRLSRDTTETIYGILPA